MTIEELANKVCEELPDRWQLNIEMENGCGSVCLYDPLGSYVNCEDSDATVEANVLEALAFAKRNEGEFS